MARQRVKSAEELWWEEDAQRLNDLGERMRRSGGQVDTEAGTPPELEDDGSLAPTPDDEDDYD